MVVAGYSFDLVIANCHGVVASYSVMNRICKTAHDCARRCCLVAGVMRQAIVLRCRSVS